MKKFSIILNVVLILITLFFGIYASLKSKEATKQGVLAEELRIEAVRLQAEAEEVILKARLQAEEAAASALEAQVQLEICQNSK